MISIICLSGAVLIFERDFGTAHQSGVTPSGRKAKSLTEILTAAESSVPSGSAISGVTIYPDSCKAYKIMLTKPAMAAMWADQYSAEVTGEYKRAEIFLLASAAHRRLFAKSKKSGNNPVVGRTVVGIASFAAIIIAVTGLMMWWPSERGGWRRAFTVPVRHGSYAFWHGLHCAGGMYATILLLICAFTGLTWSFQWYKKAFYTVCGSEVAAKADASHKIKAENYQAWDVAYSQVHRDNPDKEIRIYQGSIDVISGGIGNQQASDTYYFNKDSGQINGVKMYAGKARPSHIKGWVYSLHVGSWGGWTTRIVYFILALAGFTLPLTGYYLWLRRLLHKGHGNVGR